MKRAHSTFESLRNRNFRLFFLAQTISVTGTWMQKIGQIWLVLELSGSGTILGITVALQHLPTLLLGPWGGLLADRISKRKILLWTQATSGLLALILGLLTLTNRVQLWSVMVLALSLGVIDALDRPARSTFVLEMVGPDLLVNGITLNNIVMNAAKVIGPSIAGIFIVGAGLEAAFLINAASYGAVVTALLLMSVTELRPTPPTPRAPGQLKEGWRYVRGTPGLLGPLILVTVAGTLAYEFNVTIPLLATDVFQGDAKTVALMLSALGLGAVLGGLVVASTLRVSVVGVLVTAAIFSMMAVALAFSPTLLVALISLILLGASSIAFKAATASYIQLEAIPQMQGRVIALMLIAFHGMTGVGAPMVGWIAETFGARMALNIGAVATGVTAIWTFSYLRRREPERRAAGIPGVDRSSPSDTRAW